MKFSFKSENNLITVSLRKLSVVFTRWSIGMLLLGGSGQIVFAGEGGNDKCLYDASFAYTQTGLTGCTAGDVGIADISLISLKKGCTSTADTAIVNIEVLVTSANPSRYDIGLFLNTDGSLDAIGTGQACFHEALFPTTTVAADYDLLANRFSGIGPFPTLETKAAEIDGCGDVHNSLLYKRTMVDGDVGSGTTTAIDISLSCADNFDSSGFPVEMVMWISPGLLHGIKILIQYVILLPLLFLELHQNASRVLRIHLA